MYFSAVVKCFHIKCALEHYTSRKPRGCSVEVKAPTRMHVTSGVVLCNVLVCFKMLYNAQSVSVYL
jgi:hypothetical protein